MFNKRELNGSNEEIWVGWLDAGNVGVVVAVVSSGVRAVRSLVVVVGIRARKRDTCSTPGLSHT